MVKKSWETKWHKDNRESLLKKKREWYYKNKEHSLDLQRKRNRKKWYGLSHEEYLKILEEQKGVCAICFNTETTRNPSGVVRPLSVDHDHNTGKVRGILCSKCNKMLGNSNDNTEILERAIKYLKRNW